jgi:serine/threonine protein kinase
VRAACTHAGRAGACRGGSLQEALSSGQIAALSLAKRLKIAHDIAAGMLRLHEIDVLHRDLKTANVLIEVRPAIIPSKWVGVSWSMVW